MQPDNIIVKMTLDMGIEGTINSVFICTEEELASLQGQWADFENILGRHSDIQTMLDLDDFEILQLPTQAIDAIEEACGKSVCGPNPFKYINGETNKVNK